MAALPVEPWDVTAARLERRWQVPAAQANARLLRAAAPRWEGRVDARTSMHDLWFTPPGDEFPFQTMVIVRWTDDVFEFHLKDRRLNEGYMPTRFDLDQGDITADKCSRASSSSMLDAFLVQLVGGAP